MTSPEYMQRKSIFFYFVLICLLGLSNGYGQSISKVNKQNVSGKSGMELQEIAQDRLPNQIREYIAHDFPGSDISKAYKVRRPGNKYPEYWVDLYEGEKRWSLQFNSEGMLIKKIGP